MTLNHLESANFPFLHDFAVGIVSLFSPYSFRHPELGSGPQGRGLSTSIWRFRNKFGMTAYFRHPAIKQPQNRSPPWPSPTRGRSSRRNTSVFRTNADGERLKNHRENPKSPFSHNHAVGTVSLFPPYIFSSP